MFSRKARPFVALVLVPALGLHGCGIADDALKKAIPVTQLREIESLRAFAASLRLALPTLSVTKQDTTTSDGDTTTTTSAESRTKSLGAASWKNGHRRSSGSRSSRSPMPTARSCKTS